MVIKTPLLLRIISRLTLRGMDGRAAPLKKPNTRIAKPAKVEPSSDAILKRKTEDGPDASLALACEDVYKKDQQSPILPSEDNFLHSFHVKKALNKPIGKDERDNCALENDTKKRRMTHASSYTLVEIAGHYNSLRELGKAAREGSQIFYVRQYNNWVKSVMIQQATSLFPKQVLRPTDKFLGAVYPGSLLRKGR